MVYPCYYINVKREESIFMYCKKLLSKWIVFSFVLLACVIPIFAKNIIHPTRICDLFEDNRLAKIVASSLKKNSEEDRVTQADLDSIVLLQADNSPYKPIGICKLDGIEYLNNLEQLMLGGNNITDLSPLSNLHKLWELQLLFNATLEDITPLSTLTNMKRMSLSHTSIKDISALKDMKKLYWVCLKETHVKDFSVLSSLSHLENCDVPIPALKNNCTIM